MEQKSKGRLEVRFSGLGEHIFQIYCDQRQLKWFQRFYEDQQIKQESKDQHSSALFTLRSGRIAWQESTGKGAPWNIHHLTLYCTVDTRFWTDEGTEQVRQEKAADIAKTLTKMKDKGDLNEKQQAFVQRKNSTLARIKNPFPRPSNPSIKVNLISLSALPWDWTNQPPPPSLMLQQEKRSPTAASNNY